MHICRNKKTIIQLPRTNTHMAASKIGHISVNRIMMASNVPMMPLIVKGNYRNYSDTGTT